MTTLQDTIDQFTADAGLVHQIANGDATTVVQTGGGPVRAVAKLIADEAATIEAITTQSVGDYVSMRAYAGTSKLLNLTGYLVSVAPAGIAGFFVRDDSDTTTADDGATVIVAVNNKRWKRRFDGPVSVLWWNPACDGITDDTAAWNAATAHPAKCVSLPVGRIKIPTATLPAGVEVTGVRPYFNRGTTSFVGGSVIIGRVYPVASCKGAALRRLGIDGGTSGGNALELSQTGFDNIVFEDVVTRASNHNMLIEQNGTDPTGPISAGGNVKVIRCEGHGGPNGFACKAMNVDFIDSNVYDTTIQAFVAVSDNINGATTYSRAQNVRFRNCGGDGNLTTWRVYSRDTRSLANTNGVLAAKNIRWEGGALSGCIQHGAHIGDFSAQTSSGPVGQQTLIKNQDVFIHGARITDNGFNGVLVTRAQSVEIDENHFGNNGISTNPTTYLNQNIDYDTAGNVTDLRLGNNNVYDGTAIGKEQGIFTWPAGAGTVTLSVGAKLYKTNNTVQTFISTIQGARPGEKIEILIADDFSIVNAGKDSAGNTVDRKGIGTVVRYQWDAVAAAWIDLGATRERGAHESVGGFAQALVLDFRTSGATGRFVTVSNNITNITAVTPLTSLALTQERFIARLYNSGAAKGITAWDAVFVFPSGAPTAITAGKTRFCEFYWDGTKLVAVNTFEY